MSRAQDGRAGAPAGPQGWGASPAPISVGLAAPGAQ